MEFEQFQEKCREPVDLNKARSTLQRFIKGTFTLPVPATPNDDDILIGRVIDELERERRRTQTLSKFLDEIDTHIRATSDPLPHIIKTMREYYGYAFH